MKRSRIEFLLCFVLAFALAAISNKFLVKHVVVEGQSMYPTLQSGDRAFAIIPGKANIDRFDIVVVDAATKRNSNQEYYLVKRVIGLPNEKVSFLDNHLYINDQEVEEPFLPEGETTEDFEIKLGDDEYFVVGDNRNHSKDSRTYGPFSKKEIIADGIVSYYPIANMGIK